MSDIQNPAEDQPEHRYNAGLAGSIEETWQARWTREKTFEAPNPVGPLSEGFEKVAGRQKMFIMDMFPYPSGSGLHVGHPLGFIGTDVFARYWRMAGRNVLHTMGYDAFGLPAEQYAVQTGTHPRTTTENNIANMRRQLGRLGMGHDQRRSVATTDVTYYRWTQWIFLQLFNAWYDKGANKARPIAELRDELDRGVRTLDSGKDWNSLTEDNKLRELENYRLVYTAEAPVNWCPALGTVLANEEVTNEGRSERGNYPVYRRPMRQWMMRITAYADRLIDDLDTIDWSDSIKLMQRNWIGRSTGAEVDFEVVGGSDKIRVFTTRPDTLFGATYMVLAPEHPLVDKLVPAAWPEATPHKWKGAIDSDTPAAAVADYRRVASAKTDLDRQMDAKDKTGVFTGSFARNPVNGDEIPIFIADYVLMGYGTGAIMAVPAHDTRDFEFARKFDLPITGVIQPSEAWAKERNIDVNAPAEAWPEAYNENTSSTLVHSHNASISLDGLPVAEAKTTIAAWLQANGHGKATTTYKLRDWLFSRQRYWGEPFPILWDERDTPIAVPEHMLPVELPEVQNYAPEVVENPDAAIPEPPLGRATEWKTVTLDLGDGPKEYRRELNTMPQWAGSCWYYLRYIDPVNDKLVVDPANEKYWMNVDLYVGGVEHAVLHLLYARFWHKALYDLGHVSTIEPFQRLFNQGYVQADAFKDERGIYVDAFAVKEDNGTFMLDGKPVTREVGKMGKSKKNSINPDDMYNAYGADSLRLYEMSMGPLDLDRPWSTQGIIGLYRFLQRLWRNLIDEENGKPRVTGDDSQDTQRLLHKTIAGVRDDMEGLRFNTAIAKLIEFNNHITKEGRISQEAAEAVVLLLAPLAPHICEELWSRLGHSQSLAWHPLPEANAALLVEDEVEIPVQVQGKVRGKILIATNLPDAEVEAKALADANVARHLEGKTVRKVIVIPNKMVNIVAG